jgi:hypothetical protein
VWQLIRLSNQFHRRLMKFVLPENMYVRDVGTAGENTPRTNQPTIGDGNLPLKQLEGVRKGLFLRLLARSLSAVCRCCLYSAACKQTASLRLFTTLTLLE